MNALVYVQYHASIFYFIFIESVGVGQVELQIEKVVDSTIVVLVPESGDQAQALKAGLMEIADIYVLNKSDRPGSNTALQALYSALSHKDKHREGWDVEVLDTIASKGQGIDEVVFAIEKHRRFLNCGEKQNVKRAQRMKERIRNKVYDLIQHSLWNPDRQSQLEHAIEKIQKGEATPGNCVDEIMHDYIKDEYFKKSRDD